MNSVKLSRPTVPKITKQQPKPVAPVVQVAPVEMPAQTPVKPEVVAAAPRAPRKRKPVATPPVPESESLPPSPVVTPPSSPVVEQPQSEPEAKPEKVESETVKRRRKRNMLAIARERLDHVLTTSHRMTNEKLMKEITTVRDNILKQEQQVLSKREAKEHKTTNNASGIQQVVTLPPEYYELFPAYFTSGIKYSRVNVTQFLCSYIKEHKLQNDGDKRRINVASDPKLMKLLNLTQDDADKMTYPRLQKYINLPKVSSEKKTKSKSKSDEPEAAE
jgi:hypothetical protein